MTADRPLRIERSNSSTDENKTSSESKVKNYHPFKRLTCAFFVYKNIILFFQSTVISERQLSLENEDSEINVDQRRNLGKLQEKGTTQY